MKKTFFLLACSAITIASCTKKDTTTNYYGSGQPPFIIDGISNIVLTNGSTVNAALYLSVQYTDSAQEGVTLSLSALPTGITIDTSWTTYGIPSFNSTLTFYDTSAAGATPGTYPMTLTATSASSKKIFSFNLKVLAAPPCTSYVVGKYYNCSSSCGSGTFYTDSIYADPSVANKIWFTNFNNTGYSIYGTLSCRTSQLTVPLQTAGGNTYSGNGNFYSAHYINMDVTVNSSSFCSFTEN